MRIALLHPTYGFGSDASEAVVRSLAQRLAQANHHVTVISSGPDQLRQPSDRVDVIHAPRPPAWGTLRFYEDHLERAPGLVWSLLRSDFHVAHAFALADAWAVTASRRLALPPVAFSAPTLDRAWLVSRHYRLEMMKSVARRSACLVPDAEAADRFERYILRRPQVLAPSDPVDRWEEVYQGLTSG